jgi:hypothetical protein
MTFFGAGIGLSSATAALGLLVVVIRTLLALISTLCFAVTVSIMLKCWSNRLRNAWFIALKLF